MDFPDELDVGVKAISNQSKMLFLYQKSDTCKTSKDSTTFFEKDSRKCCTLLDQSLSELCKF